MSIKVIVSFEVGDFADFRSRFEQARPHREEAGISEGLIRLSIGIESVDDLIEDLEKGFRTAAKALKK